MQELAKGINTGKLNDMNLCLCKHVKTALNMKKPGEKSRKHFDTCLHGWIMYFHNPSIHKLEATPEKAKRHMMDDGIPKPPSKRQRI